MFLKGDARIASYKPPLISDQQITALEAFIIRSADATPFAKKAILWALRASSNLSTPVALSLWSKDFTAQAVADAQDGSHDMHSSNGKTHLNYFFDALQTEFGVSDHCGCFVPMRGVGNIFNCEADGVTLWVSHTFFDDNAFLLRVPSPTELEEIPLKTS